MKKFLSILAIAAMLFLAPACGNRKANAPVEEEAPVEVVDSAAVAEPVLDAVLPEAE